VAMEIEHKWVSVVADRVQAVCEADGEVDQPDTELLPISPSKRKVPQLPLFEFAGK
jgi:hypothetical protein